MRPSVLMQAIAGGGVLAVAGFSAVCIVGYYPAKIAMIVSVTLLAFLALALFRPSPAIFLLFAIGPLFGNHPGGRFMELFPILVTIWTGAGVFVASLPARSLAFLRINGIEFDEKDSRDGGVPLFLASAILFVLIVFLTLLAQPWTLLDAVHRERDPFHLLMADEHSPLYSIQQTLWTSLLPVFAISLNGRLRNHGGRNGGEPVVHAVAGLATGLVLTVLIGIFELWVPSVARGLDAYHLFIDGYVNRNPSGVLSFAGFESPNSLFWNRSWHSMYLIASLPFFFLFASRWSHAKVIGVSVFAMAYFALLGARGGLLAFVAFLVVFLPVHFFHRLRLFPLKAYLMVAIVVALILHTVLPAGMVLGGLELKEARFAQYAEGIRLFLRFPWTGGGIESYGFYNTSMLQPLGLAALHGTSHSQWLQILSGTGLPGAFAYLLLLVLALRGPYLRLLEGAADSAGSIFARPLVLLAGMISLLVYSTFQEWWYLKPVQTAWWLLVFLCIRETPRSPAILSTDHLRRAIYLLPFFALLIVLWGPGMAERYLPARPPVGEVLLKGEAEVLPIRETGIWKNPPRLLWKGVEYQGGGRFLIFAGTSWIAFPSDSQPSLQLTPVAKDGRLFSPKRIEAGWVVTKRADSPGGFLYIECVPDPVLSERRRDYDGRRLCAGLNAPAFADVFEREGDTKRHQLR